MKKLLQVTCIFSSLLMSAHIRADANADLLGAATRGDLAGVRHALSGRNKADINIRGAKNRTPLMWAADTGHLDVVKCLVRTGKADIDAQDERSMTALMLAAYHGHTEVVKYLVEKAHADVTIRGPFGKTALGLARFRGHSDIAHYLRNHSA